MPHVISRGRLRVTLQLKST